MQEPREPLDIRHLAGDRYKVAYDPSVKVDRVHQSDVRFYTIRCKHGTVSTHSDRELSAYCTSRKLFGRLATIPTARIVCEEPSEVTIAFSPEQLPEVCGLLKARPIRTHA